jgi:hypothetical protein
MELIVEHKIIIALLIFITIWMSLSFKNVLCEGRAGFGLCYNKSCPPCVCAKPAAKGTAPASRTA